MNRKSCLVGEENRKFEVVADFNKAVETEAEIPVPSSPVTKFCSAVALVSAALLAGCAAGNEAQKVQELESKLTSAEHDLSACIDKKVEDNGQAVMVTFGTFGVKVLKPGKENVFHVNPVFSGMVTETMMFWPPVLDEKEIRLDGATAFMTKVKLGDFWGIAYRSQVEQPKETLVIDVGSERYVVFVVRK